MTIDVDALYRLLPAIHRMRDAEAGEPLKQFLSVLAEQAAVVEEQIEQQHDDLFIETCADWVAPYIGGLIGYRPLHGITARVASPRAEVANTIGYRRRKGTAAVLEQLARDVTGWPAHAVEYFQFVATCQYMNHLRFDHAYTPDMRDWEGLARIATAFDTFSHTVDVRSIETADGRHNLPNIGIFLWRLEAFRRTASPAVEVDAQRFLFSPLGAPVPLFHAPVAEERISQLATPLNVPEPIGRRALHEDLADLPSHYYGPDADGALQSLIIDLNGAVITAADVECCNLSDEGGGWANVPANAGDPVAIDPVLGRIALPPDREGPVTVAYHYGFSAAMGGGEYGRSSAFMQATSDRPRLEVPSADHPDIQSALDALPAAGGIVEVVDNGRYDEALGISLGADAVVELRAADNVNPLILLTGDLTVFGGDGAQVTIDGFLIARGGVSVPDVGGNALAGLTLRHVTLVPGFELDADGNPAQPGAVSIAVELPNTRLDVEHSISGPIRLVQNAEGHFSNSLVDAAAADPLDSSEGVAFAAPAPAEPADDFGGALSMKACTVLGKIAAQAMPLVSNSILFAALADADTWPAPVRVARRQDGCVRFSYVPTGSVVPRRYRCQPQLAIEESIAARELEIGGPIGDADRQEIIRRESRRIIPGFSSRRYGRPDYGQLRRTTPTAIREGADDESEMGVFHDLFQPQRETNLRIRLEEYLRFGLEAGAFFET